MFTIKDVTVNRVPVTVADRWDVVPSIRSWFPDAPVEVAGALEELSEALEAHIYTGELEAFLGIRISQTR